MIVKKLSNGLKVIYKKTSQSTVSVNLTVNLGSNDEPKGIKGISHFIEHMLFEGTKKRPTSLAIASEIENLGGEFNAFTNNERTSYYVKIPKQYLDVALEVISDMVFNSQFADKHIKKEKKVVLNEIGSLYDDPRLYQWLLFEKTLYQKAPLMHPVIGYKEDVASLNRNKIMAFYKKYYHPGNMVLSIVGNVQNPIKSVSKYYDLQIKGKILRRLPVFEPEKTKEIKKIEIKKLNQAYLIVGYTTTTVDKKDSFALDLIRSILGRGFSGRLFDEIRNKRGLAYDLGVISETKISYGYFAIYASIKKENLDEVLSLIKKEISNLGTISKKDLDDAKRFIKGEFIMHYEDNSKLANYLCFLAFANNLKLFNSYLKVIDKITINDIIKCRDTYLKNPAIVILK